MNLAEWARVEGIHVTAGCRWYRDGELPVSAGKVGRLILVSRGLGAVPAVRGGAGLYVRVSCHGQRAGLGRRVARLRAWAARAGLLVVGVEAGVGLGVNGWRARARRLLAGPAATVVVVERRGRLGRVNTELAEAAAGAQGRGLAVLDDGAVTGGLVGDMVEVLSSFCARLYGRGSARNRAVKAVGCARRDVGPRAALRAGGVPCGGGG